MGLALGVVSRAWKLGWLVNDILPGETSSIVAKCLFILNMAHGARLVAYMYTLREYEGVAKIWRKSGGVCSQVQLPTSTISTGTVDLSSL